MPRLQIVRQQSACSVWIVVMLVLILGRSAWADDETYGHHPELGVTVSSLVHPSVGYWWGRTGLRFSGIYLNDHFYEYHVNIGYVLSDSGTVQQGINVLTSWVSVSDAVADYDYAATGIAYSLNYNGFFFELGLAVPWKDELGNLSNNPVIPCGYWGYIHRF